MRRNSGEHSGKNDNRRTIPYARFRDNITEPEEDHRSCSDEEHRWKDDSPEIRSIDNLCATITCTNEGIEEVDHPIALCEREWDREIASIVIDLLLTLIAFFLQGLEGWDDDRKELDNDRRIDIRRKTHEDHGEMLESTSHNGTKEGKLSIGLELRREAFEERDIHPWNRDDGEELVDSDDPEGDEDLLADMFCFPDFSDISDHK